MAGGAPPGPRHSCFRLVLRGRRPFPLPLPLPFPFPWLGEKLLELENSKCPCRLVRGLSILTFFLLPVSKVVVADRRFGVPKAVRSSLPAALSVVGVDPPMSFGKIRRQLANLGCLSFHKNEPACASLSQFFSGP